MREHQAPELETPMDDVLQEEAPPLTAIPVVIEGPTRTVSLPAKQWMAGQVTVDSTGGFIQPNRVLGEDPRRARVQLIAKDHAMRVGTSQKQVMSPFTCAVWPIGVPLTIAATSEVWVASDQDLATVSYVAELWAD
ncbi:hypothetical protein ACFRCW_42380 [Streptomyces sp. NPDC056653]|uniref:hypothetical protein n=1 Tax=Streptomyces sp. NPDC056653 TaxID=3345894 RepID=UPI0036AB1F68